MIADRDRNALSYWFPAVQEAQVLHPKSEIVRTEADLIPILNGERVEGFDQLIEHLTAACDRMGYPCFLRTGHTADKFRWKNTCHIPDPICIERHVFNLIQFSWMANSVLPVNEWVVREYLPCHPVFTAFSGRLPIRQERRYFVRDGKVQCHHPYWPVDAIHKPDHPRWQFLLEEVVNRETPDEIEKLTVLSEKVGALLQGGWSIKWMWVSRWDQPSGWYCVDMAVADTSWHWPSCPVVAQAEAGGP